jgi:hypothetical protein
MKVEAANICVSCDELVENDEKMCPKCFSEVFLPLATIIVDPMPERTEGREWTLKEVIDHWAQRRKRA